MPAGRAWRLQHDLDVSAEAIAAAEAERDAADARVTATWNSLFSIPPASSAELLALLRHAQHHVDESHAPDAAIELSSMVRAIGDAVEGLRTIPFEAEGGETALTAPDRFLTDLAPTLLPLLDEASTVWAGVKALYKQAEDACGPWPEHPRSEAEFRAHRDKFDAARNASGHSAAAEASRPLFERLEAMVGPLMNVPVQTLEGLILKQRIGQTLDHYSDDAADDLSKLVAGYKPSAPTPHVGEPVDWHAPPAGFMAYPALDPQGFVIVREGLRLELERLHRIALAEYNRKIGPDATDAARNRVRQELRLDTLSATSAAPASPNLVGMLDLASATMTELQSIRDVAERVGSVAYVHAWGPRCRDRVNASGAPHFNAAGKLVQWVGDALTAVESAAEEEARRRTPESRDDRETRLSMLAVTIIDNGDPDETEGFARELLAHAQAERQGR